MRTPYFLCGYVYFPLQVTLETSLTIDDLEPNTRYMISVEARTAFTPQNGDLRGPVLQVTTGDRETHQNLMRIN